MSSFEHVLRSCVLARVIAKRWLAMTDRRIGDDEPTDHSSE